LSGGHAVSVLISEQAGRPGFERIYMDVTKILAELRQERDQIEEAIITLERLAQGRGKRRGRPPQWLQEARKRAAKAVGAKGRAAAIVKAMAN